MKPSLLEMVSMLESLIKSDSQVLVIEQPSCTVQEEPTVMLQPITIGVQECREGSAIAYKFDQHYMVTLN